MKIDGVFYVTNILKKTKARIFKDLEVGDAIWINY